MGIPEVHRIQAGKKIGTITRNNVADRRLNVFEFCDGVLPEDVGHEAVQAFVAREPDHGFDEVAIVVDRTREGIIEVDIDPRDTDLLEHHPKHIDGIFAVTMAACGIDTRTAYVDPEIIDQEEVLAA